MPLWANLVLSCWAIAKTTTGLKAIALCPFSGSTVSVSWLVCRPSIVGPSNRGIAKTPYPKAFFRLRKQLLSDPPLGTQTHPRTNTGFFSKLCMASVGVHATGTTKSTPFFDQLVSLPARMTHACTLVLYEIQKILPVCNHPNPLH